MGASSSKVAQRTYPAAQQAVQHAAEAAAVEHAPRAVAADAQRASRPGALTLEEEEQLLAKDADLGGLLDKLGGSVSGRNVDVMPKQALRTAPRKMTAAEENAGRLPEEALRLLFDLQRRAQGRAPDVSFLLTKYKADSQTVEDVLRYTAPPTITSAPNSEGVQGIAGWPSWFRRERAK